MINPKRHTMTPIHQHLSRFIHKRQQVKARAILAFVLLVLSPCGFAQTNAAFKLVIATNTVTAPVYVREVGDKFYDIRYSQLWHEISGKILERNTAGAIIQTYVTNQQVESVWIPSNLNAQQSVGAYAGAGSSGGHYVDRVVSESIEPDKKIQLRNFRIGAVGQAVTIRAMMISGSKEMEVWDCGLPHKVVVVSTNRIHIITP